MTIIIHTGLHKSGTSFLQERIFPNLDNVNYKPLCVRNGIKHIIQYRLYPNMINLISSEHLTNQNFVPYEEASPYTIADRLKQLFPDAKIIFTTRDKETWKNSLYNHYIKASIGTLTRKEWEEQVFKDIDLRNYINHLRNLFDDILILKYEQLKTSPDEYLSTLCDFIGVPVPEYDNSPVLKSFNNQTIDFICNVNKSKLIPQFGKNILISLVRGSYWKQKYKM